MERLRTPDDRFAGLADFDFAPRYAFVTDLDGDEPLRMHYLDEGPSDGPVVLLVHGEPTWSFLYRKMIDPLVVAGCRVIVPDLIGFGRSDKPTEPGDYTYQRQVDWTSELVFDELDLGAITFFGQDWGGLIGLRAVAAKPDRFRGVVISNTGLPTGQTQPSEVFVAWQQFCATAEEFPVGSLVAGACASELSAEAVAAYDAPFPDDTFKAGARTMPSLVPTSTDDPQSAANIAAWAQLETFDKPFLCAFGDSDPLSQGAERSFIARVPGAATEPHTWIEGGGHFIQEDAGPRVAALIIDQIRREPRSSRSG